jgi:hypothetical protein
MPVRFKAFWGAVAASALLAGATAGTASADPITCSGGQTATHTDSGWQCINNGGNDTGSGRHQGNDNKFGHTFP